MLFFPSVQDYRSIYLNFYAEFRQDRDEEKEEIIDYVVFNIELAKQVNIDVVYILMLVEKYRSYRGKDLEIRVEMSRAVDAAQACATRKTWSRHSSTWFCNQGD